MAVHPWLIKRLSPLALQQVGTFTRRADSGRAWPSAPTATTDPSTGDHASEASPHFAGRCARGRAHSANSGAWPSTATATSDPSTAHHASEASPHFAGRCARGTGALRQSGACLAPGAAAFSVHSAGEHSPPTSDPKVLQPRTAALPVGCGFAAGSVVNGHPSIEQATC
jgi:hypothetical protein